MSTGSKASNDRRAGQPVVVLLVLLGLWAGGRSVLWESPFPTELPTLELPTVFAEAEVVDVIENDLSPPSSALEGSSTEVRKASFAAIAFRRLRPSHTSSIAPSTVSGAWVTEPAMTLASHQLMWMSAMSSVPVPPEIAALISPAIGNENIVSGVILDRPQRNESNRNRWSLDGWLFLRPNSISNAGAGPTPSTYGASQAGAVLRFDLAPSSDRKPAAYARVTSALAGSRESAVAAGLSARPIARVPVSAHAEMRATRVGGATEIRPAVFAVTELMPQKLPLGARITAYGQAGYVGGNFATAFADGQAKIDRKVADFNLATLRAGVGVWGGVQKDAGRLDVGPTASVDITIGKTPARFSMDYRQRIAGDAEPQSGVAITLSTGF